MNSTAKQIARQRVQVLFQQARRTYKANPQLAQRYIATARKIAMAAQNAFTRKLQAANLQELQHAPCAGRKQPSANKTEEGTSRRNHLLKVRSSDAYSPKSEEEGENRN